ncbi:MAG: META domain-containing protein [bacterium]
MKRTIIIAPVISVALVLLVAGLFTIKIITSNDFTVDNVVGTVNTPLSATYTIENQKYSLEGGQVEKQLAPGSASVDRVSIFGNPIYGDFNNDGVLDAAVILAQNMGGSGTFYFAALSINIEGFYKGTNAIFLGDRITPKKIEVRNGRAVYNFLDRKITDSFVSKPTINKSVIVNLDSTNMQISEIVQKQEIYTTPIKINLNSKIWTWVKTQYNNDTVVEPKKSGLFTVKFNVEGSFSAQTDCNSMGGGYKVVDNKISFSNMFSTLMYCDGSQEQEYTKMLGEASSYLINDKNNMIISLKMDSGTMIFK